MFRAVPLVESLLRRAPALWRLLDRHGPTRQLPATKLADHVVIVGYGRVGQHISQIACAKQLLAPDSPLPAGARDQPVDEQPTTSSHNPAQPQVAGKP